MFTDLWDDCSGLSWAEDFLVFLGTTGAIEVSEELTNRVSMGVSHSNLR